MQRSRRWSAVVILAFVAVLVVQLGWLLAVGPFRGMDEFDHAQHAESVAHGRWRPDGVDVVDRSFAEAVLPVCQSIRRTESQRCGVVDATRDGRVRVITSSNAYNPVYYAVVGPPALLAHGYDRLYLMRLVSMVVGAILLAVALTESVRSFASPWPSLALVLTLTPIATYGSTVVAPNGWEASCASLLWVSLLAIRSGRVEDGDRRRLQLCAGVAGVGLLTFRSLGPLWFLAIVALSLLVPGRRAPDPASGGVVARLRSWRWCRAAWLAAAGAGIAWTLAAGTNQQVGQDTSGSLGSAASEVGSAAASSGSRADLPGQLVVWVAQTVGTIPYRADFLPLAVYAFTLALWCAALGLLWRLTGPPIRRVIVLTLAASLAAPVAFVLVTGAGLSWQGRYGWPLTMGVFLVAGVGADRATDQPGARTQTVAVGAGALLAGVSVALCQAVVLHRQHARDPLAGISGVLTAPAAVLVVLTLLAFGLLAAIVLRTRPDARRTPST